MNKDEQTFATAKARLAELWELRGRFRTQDKPPEQWMADCISMTQFLLVKGDKAKGIDATDLLVTLALGMWQAGYEAAPQLEFLLPEGPGG